MFELGEQLHLDSSTLTPLIQKLILLGAVEKTRDTEDERVVRMFLTDAGKAICEQHRNVGAKVEAQLGLSAAEIKTVRALMEKIIAGAAK